MIQGKIYEIDEQPKGVWIQWKLCGPVYVFVHNTAPFTCMPCSFHHHCICLILYQTEITSCHNNVTSTLYSATHPRLKYTDWAINVSISLFVHLPRFSLLTKQISKQYTICQHVLVGMQWATHVHAFYRPTMARFVRKAYKQKAFFSQECFS